ncbi:unnamed protein product, partial [Mesorhabditis spiculigera]
MIRWFPFLFAAAALLLGARAERVEITHVEPEIKNAEDYSYVQVEAGKKLTIQCHLSGGGNIKWLFPKNEDVLGFDLRELNQRVSILPNEEQWISTLTIADMSQSDTGLYTCQNENNKEAVDSIYVFVTGPVVMLKPASDQLAASTQRMIIPCRTTEFPQTAGEVKLFLGSLDIPHNAEYDPRTGFTLDKFPPSELTSGSGKARCQYKDSTISFTVAKNNASQEFNFTLVARDDWAYAGAVNYTINCTLAVIRGEARMYKHKLEFLCPRCNNTNAVAIYNNRQHAGAFSLVLNIFSVTQEDAGEYSCIWSEEEASKEYQTKKTKMVKLAVSKEEAQIRFMPHHEELILNEGQSIDLVAAIKAYPFDLPNYSSSWKREYVTVSNNHSDPITHDEGKKIESRQPANRPGEKIEELKIINANTNDSGIYELSVQVKGLLKKTSWNVTVNTKTPRVAFQNNTQIRMQCVSSGVPLVLPKLQSRESRRGGGRFTDVPEAELETIYGTFEAGVSWRPYVSKDMLVRCMVRRGDKDVSDEQPISVANHGFRTWSNVTKAASSKAGEHKELLYAGDNVTLSCETLWQDGLEIKWKHEDTELEGEVSESGPTMIKTIELTNISPSNNGRYQCLFIRRGRVTVVGNETITVQRVRAPTPSEKQGENFSFPYHKNGTLECKMSGQPTPEIEWKKNGEPVEARHISADGSTLTINRVVEDDAGIYTCVAENRAGSYEAKYNVEVDGAPNRHARFWIILLLAALICISLCSCLALYKWRQQRKRANEQEGALRILYDELMRGGVPSHEIVDQKVPIDQRVADLPYERRLELNQENLQLGQHLGSGEFGRVVMGWLKKPARVSDSAAERARLPVAVKMPRNGNDVKQQKMLSDELKVMGAIAPHPNVLAIIGAITKQMVHGRLFLVVEICDKGSLRDYLRNLGKTSQNFKNDLRPAPASSYLQPNSAPKKVYLSELNEENGHAHGAAGEQEALLEHERIPPSSTAELLSFSMQIANGMEYLSSVPCVHRDLAARNVLLTKDKVCRIADFGMAKNTEKEYYRKTRSTENKVPVRWTSPEAITHGYYTQASDVWSFGILLYEIFTLGGTPYPDLSNEETLPRVLNGTRNSQPEFAHDDIFNLMQQCWMIDPSKRPLFTDCVHLLKEHLRLCSSPLLEQVEDQLQAEWARLESYRQWREQPEDMKNQPRNKGETTTLSERPPQSPSDRGEHIYIQDFPARV